MTRGIVLIAVGNKGYGKFAFNMAMTIKYFNPDTQIQLICEEKTISGLPKQFFDIITPVEQDDLYTLGKVRRKEVLKLNPGKLKISVYKYLAFDRNIYLDIDGVCIRDVKGLFDECEGHYYRSQIVGQASITADNFPEMMWAPIKEIRKRYPMSDNAIVPALNSSFQYIEKGSEAEKLYALALANFNDPIPRMPGMATWGGSEPDELYMNIALAQVGLMPILERTPYPIYFRIYKDIGPAKPLKEIQYNHFVIGVFGDRQFNHSSLVASGSAKSGGYYDRIVSKCSRELLGTHQQFKIHSLMKEKHVLKK